jgi:nitroreductase
MQTSVRHDPVRELALLARVPEPGSHNLGEFLANHADELAQALDADPHRLALARALDDEELLPRIVQLLERARGRRALEDLDRRRERSIAAAIRLGQTARWTDLGAELDVDLLLGDVLADRTRKWVSFEAEGMSVTIPRHLIAATVFVARQHLDLAAVVNGQGLHFCWRGGKGRYRWRSHSLRPGLEAHVLTVALAPKVVRVVVPEPRVARQRRVKPVLEPVAALTAANDVTGREPDPLPAVVPAVATMPERRKGGAWLRDILRELGHI